MKTSFRFVVVKCILVTSNHSKYHNAGHTVIPEINACLNKCEINAMNNNAILKMQDADSVPVLLRDLLALIS